MPERDGAEWLSIEGEQLFHPTTTLCIELNGERCNICDHLSEYLGLWS